MPRPRCSDEQRHGEIGRYRHVREAVGEGGIEDHLQPIDGYDTAIDDLEALRCLHPVIGGENPGCGNERPGSHHDGGETHRPFWDKAFGWGSYIATFSQGVALGAFINGFKVTGTSYDGGNLDWLSPFSLFTGVSLIVAYGLLGCTWLIMKTEGELQHRVKALARPVTLVLVAAIGIVSVWTPLTHPSIATR